MFPFHLRRFKGKRKYVIYVIIFQVDAEMSEIFSGCFKEKISLVDFLQVRYSFRVLYNRVTNVWIVRRQFRVRSSISYNDYTNHSDVSGQLEKVSNLSHALCQ